jgi:hypothetical protein
VQIVFAGFKKAVVLMIHRLKTSLKEKIRSRLVSSMTCSVGPEVTVIYTPFKVGSTSMFERLVRPFFCTGGHYQALREGVPQECLHYTLKCHSDGVLDLFKLREQLQSPIRRVITFVRNQGEIYLSAFFQDIDSPNLPYYFGSRTDVLAADAEDLSKHFLKIDWPALRHLQIMENMARVREYTTIDYSDDLKLITRDGFLARQGHSTNGEDVIVAAAHVGILSQPDRFRLFLRDLRYPWYIRQQIPLQHSANVGSKKWYADVYKQVKADPRVIEAIARWNEPFGI